MEKHDTFTRILASFGTFLVWIPLLSPVALSAISWTARHTLLFDYLMPAELFPLALVGGGLLLLAAFRAHSRRGLVGGSLGGAAALLVGGQALAVATGLASGDTQPAGWPFALVLASLGLYSLALVVMGVGGVLLLRDLFKAPAPSTRAV